MKTVHKFKLQMVDQQTVLLPFGAEVLTVQFQNDVLCLWAIVESDNSPEPRRIFIHGTGHRIYETGLRYIGTVQQMDRQLVWHVFERP